MRLTIKVKQKMTLKWQILLMKFEITQRGEGYGKRAESTAENGVHKGDGGLILNKKPAAHFLPLSLHVNWRSWMTLVLLLPCMDEELDE